MSYKNVNAKFESEMNGHSIMYVNLSNVDDVKGWDAIKRTVEALVSYGYDVSHWQEGECIMLGYTSSITISQMKEDWKAAKKDAKKLK